MRAIRRPGVSYSEVILRLVELKKDKQLKQTARSILTAKFAGAKMFRLGRHTRIGRFTPDRAETASRWLTRTLSEGPYLGVFPQTYHE
jgi:hypothetical protein